ncbi:MAG TPA: DUF1552 domain-containing protein [Polyangiaceae bacterium]|nr:DUF1552 domain-containing protein [Polyangiaceae bacterium]
MFTHHGCITNHWFPLKLEGDLTTEDLTRTTLAPLAQFAKKLLMPRGIRSMNEWTANNKGAGQGRGQGADVHMQVVGSALTCQPVSPNSNEPFGFNKWVRISPMPVGPSLDHVMAQQLSPLGTPLLLNTTGQVREAATTAISYSEAGKGYSALNATQAFAKLTNLFQPNAPLNEGTWAVAKGKAIADIVKGDLSRLMAQNMSKADKEKLAAWVELANEVGRGLVSVAQCSQDTATRLGASNQLAGGSGDVLTRKVTSTLDNADLYSAIATLTAACNANPVIVLKYPGVFVFSGLGIQKDSSGLAHRVGDASMAGPCLPDVVQTLLRIDGYYAQKFANLVKMLDDIGEAEGTLLDNTIAVWLNENSDGCAHNLNNMPIIQAGSGGGYFKTGKIVDLDPDSGATAQDMLGRSLSQCVEGTADMADGVRQGTGTDPRFGNAPVNKYFCNIMNAMGIKADANGYPAKDGTNSEVTRYGYSDKTEDFAGGVGAVEGATIHDPGGFTALQA